MKKLVITLLAVLAVGCNEKVFYVDAETGKPIQKYQNRNYVQYDYEPNIKQLIRKGSGSEWTRGVCVNGVVYLSASYGLFTPMMVPASDHDKVQKPGALIDLKGVKC